MEHPRQLHKVM